MEIQTLVNHGTSGRRRLFTDSEVNCFNFQADLLVLLLNHEYGNGNLDDPFTIDLFSAPLACRDKPQP